jgi:hypothetical protein
MFMLNSVTKSILTTILFLGLFGCLDGDKKDDYGNPGPLSVTYVKTVVEGDWDTPREIFNDMITTGTCRDRNVLSEFIIEGNQSNGYYYFIQMWDETYISPRRSTFSYFRPGDMNNASCMISKQRVSGNRYWFNFRGATSISIIRLKTKTHYNEYQLWDMRYEDLPKDKIVETSRSGMVRRSTVWWTDEMQQSTDAYYHPGNDVPEVVLAYATTNRDTFDYLNSQDKFYRYAYYSYLAVDVFDPNYDVVAIAYEERYYLNYYDALHGVNDTDIKTDSTIRESGATIINCMNKHTYMLDMDLGYPPVGTKFVNIWVAAVDMRGNRSAFSSVVRFELLD